MKRIASLIRLARYVVFPINNGQDGSLYLGHPCGVGPAWRVRQYLQGCYAALALPEFSPITPTGGSR